MPGGCVGRLCLERRYQDLTSGIRAFLKGGLVLVSGNYDDPPHAGPGISKHFKAASLAETWAAHKARLEELVSTGRDVLRQPGSRAER